MIIHKINVEGVSVIETKITRQFGRSVTAHSL